MSLIDADPTPPNDPPGGNEPPADPPPSDPPSGGNEPWFYAEGVPGIGERPEFLKGDKYKSIADQAKAYTELEKKFGGFTGAPDGDYEMSLPEGTAEGDQAKELLESLVADPRIMAFQGIAKEAGMNQGAFTQALHAIIGAELGMNQKMEAENVLNGIDWERYQADPAYQKEVQPHLDGITIEGKDDLIRASMESFKDRAAEQAEYAKAELSKFTSDELNVLKSYKGMLKDGALKFFNENTTTAEDAKNMLETLRQLKVSTNIPSNPGIPPSGGPTAEDIDYVKALTDPKERAKAEAAMHAAMRMPG